MRLLGFRKYEEYCFASKVRVLLVEVQQHTNGALWVDFGLIVPDQITQLTGRGVVKSKNDRLSSGRKLNLPVDIFCHTNGAIPVLVQPLQILLEILNRTSPARFLR